MLELLSPAGSMEALRAAVQNGANAVYLGAGGFNARMGAKNFTVDELREAVVYCHIRGVKVHLTLNTLVSDRELPAAGEVIRQAGILGVDAFIVQDLGMLSLCRQMTPDIPIHASTQMSLHCLEGVRRAAQMGCTRVVLARELSREQIAYICRNSPIEIEVFGHGALCMSYSGQCWFSAVIGRRSGNRGGCAQPCRMACGYGRHEGRFPLSLKDSCLIEAVGELERMGVASLKIEGRMKRPEYVAIVTRIYRRVLDGRSVSRGDLQDLERAFSRQGFTRGYYDSALGSQMLGTRQDDGEHKELFAAARATYERGDTPRVPIRFYAMIRRDQPAMLAVEDDQGRILKAVGEIPQEAVSRSLTEEELAQRMEKTGGTPYYVTDCKAVIDRGISVPASALNAMRRDALSHLTAVRGQLTATHLNKYTAPRPHPGQTQPPELTVALRNPRQLTNGLLSAKPAVLYVPLSLLCEHPGMARQLPEETELAAILPRVTWDSQSQEILRQLDLVHNLGVRRVLTGNLGQLSLAASRGFEARGDFGLNVFNSRTMGLLRHEELVSATASFELMLAQVRDLSKPLPLELIAYGRLPLMLTENCLIKNRSGVCACQGGAVTKLVDRTGAEFPVLPDPGTCRSVVYNGKKLYLLDKLPDLRRLGLWALRLQFTTENPQEVDRVVDDWAVGGEFEPGQHTRGLYLRGVE